MDRAEVSALMESQLADEDAHAARVAYARATAEAIQHVGDVLQAGGFIMRDDAARGLSLATRMAGALAQGTCDLLDAGNRYAAAALTRQLVEVEYLLWTFADDAEDGARWLHASRSQLTGHFKPAAMRERSAGRFHSREYRLHCEFGGHPSPRGGFLLGDQLDRSGWVDLGQHLESAWGLLMTACDGAGWTPDEERAEAVERARVEWHERDLLAQRLPPAPEEGGDWDLGPHLGARAD